MLNLCDILKLIIDSFYKCAFPQANLVGNAHKRVFHIILDFGKQLDAINKKTLEKGFSNIPLISEKLSFYVFQESSLFQWLSVINAACRKNKIQYFAFVVDYQVQFEPKEPTHRAFATACKSFKGSVDENTLVTAYTQRCAIHKTYSRTFSKQHLLDKSRHLQQHLLFKFNKTVVRNSFGEQMFAMLTDVVQVVMFETTESTRVEMYEYDNNLCIAHTIRLTTVALAIGW